MKTGHYIREWRIQSGLSLRKLAARMESSPGEELISFASLGRIERGKQPYSQPIIEALADALDIEPYMLLEVNPEKDGEIIDVLKILKGEKRQQVIGVLKALSQ